MKLFNDLLSDYFFSIETYMTFSIERFYYYVSWIGT